MCDDLWQKMRSGSMEMKPLFFEQTQCQGLPLTYEIERGYELKRPIPGVEQSSIQSYILPENYTVKFYRRASRMETTHDYRYQEVIIPDTSLEVVEWYPNGDRRPLDEADAFKVEKPNPPDYFTALAQSCHTSGQPLPQMFTWKVEDCSDIINISKKLHQLAPALTQTKENQDEPTQTEEPTDATNGQNKENSNSVSNSSSDFTIHDWYFWLAFAFVIVAMLVFMCFYWWSSRRKNQIANGLEIDARLN